MHIRLGARVAVSTLVSALLLGLLPSGVGTAQAVEPAADRSRPAAEAPVISGTLEEFLAQIPPVEPMMSGYKGTSSFIPPAVAKGKDKRGCNLRQRMLIDAAYTKPKVGKKCALSGGVWWVDGGTKKVTRAKDVTFATALTLAEAWGQGASQWTPQQRLAWATQVDRSTPAAGVQTRARAVSALAATQQIVSETTKKEAEAQVALKDRKIEVIVYRTYCNRGLFTLAAMATNEFIVTICSQKWTDAEVKAILNADDAIDQICWREGSRMLNVVSWGLSLAPDELQQLEAVLGICKEEGMLSGTYVIAMASEQYKIARIPQPTTVTTSVIDPDGVDRGTTVVKVPFQDYSGQATTAPITSELFGVAAPVDWGDPGVPTGYLRLWDAGVSWRQMQPDKDKPIDWTKLDATMAMASRIGAKVMYVLGDTPGWANGGKSGAVPPTNLDDAARFISQVCSRYKGSTPIRAFEAWNEGNLETFWTGSMSDLAELTSRVHSNVRACGKLYASSTGTRSTNAFATKYPEYLRELEKRYWPVDGYTVHSYPAADGGPAQRIEEIAQFKTLLVQNRAPARPILDTELNYGLAGLGQDRRAIDPSTGAAYLSQSFIQSVQYGVDSLFWFLWTQADYDKLGIQLNAGTPQTIQAWKQTYSWLVGRQMTRCADGLVVQACQLTGAKGNITLLWTKGPEVSVDVTGLGSTVQYLDGTSLPIGSSKTIGLG
ncbi:MAG TPA: hypothetical protein DCQ36_02570, partial [Actinobacteria bacterium]|nr:hypothetical protein [Actinomycetota bacterium]